MNKSKISLNIVIKKVKQSSKICDFLHIYKEINHLLFKYDFFKHYVVFHCLFMWQKEEKQYIKILYIEVLIYCQN